MRDNLQFSGRSAAICVDRVFEVVLKKRIIFRRMTDSMNFGPDWIRNLSSEGTTGGGTSSSSSTRYQLADYRYGREEMLALFERNIKPPACLANFKSLFSETSLPPLALVPPSEEERSGWQGRPVNLGGPPRGRGSLERGGRINRGGRGGYQSYGRPANYEGGWGNGEPSDWSPRKEYSPRPASMDNWRRARNNDEDDGWRMSSVGRGMHEKWGRQTSWRGEGDDERTGPPERGGRTGGWQEVNRGPLSRRSWDNEDHLPEWANENPLESGGSFDDRGAFHGSDEEQEGKKGAGLHKSTSQQHISHKAHPPLLTSKSTISLVKDSGLDLSNDRTNSLDVTESSALDVERKLSVPDVIDKSLKEVIVNNRDRAKSEGPMKNEEFHEMKLEPKVEENDFEKLQDFVSKLVVDEEPRKPNGQQQNSYEMSGLVQQPNLPIPGHDKWFYQDPQGQMQGPFTNVEMCEWSKAGYFGKDLKVRRQCDERFYLLGELTEICSNANPFQANIRFPVLKNDISKMPEGDLQFQLLSQLAAYKQAQARVMADPWSAIAVQQQELAAQRLIMQQQQDIQYIPQATPSNPLMQMISQMQQANKLSNPGLIDKQQPPNMDPHMHMHMSNFLSLQNRMQPNQIPASLPLPNENLAAGMSNLPGVGIHVPRPSPVEHNDNDPISSLLKQLQQQKQQQVESLWQQNQFGGRNSSPTQQQQWPNQVQQQQQQQPPQVPLSMWNVQQSQPPVNIAQPQPAVELVHPQPEPLGNEKEKLKKNDRVKDNKHKEDEKESKKKKKAEEEQQQKKDVEERRKQEQRKLETDKKAEVERKRKEEEKIKKELEKAKKEAEDKRMRELEEKRRLKEQRKLEEEAKKRTDEERRIIEEDRIQREKEQRDREERQKAEERRQEQLSMSKAAPWSQANSAFGMSLADIQKAEKERKVQEAALQAQRAQIEKSLLLQQQQQQMLEKSGFGWAKKAMEHRDVIPLTEIQAEEQGRLAKEAAEARLKKEKEARESVQHHHHHHHQTTNSIWSGQGLNWASASQPSQPQWSEFWGAEPKTATKPSAVSKSSSMSTINYSASKQAQPQPPKTQPQQKAKPKKDEAGSNKKNHNNNVEDDFTSWCFKALANISSDVDVPTFISFLKDIESAFEVREYCKEYLGESNTTQQFANNFLEKRRSFKPKQAHKDDMCSPAPAITPSMHNTAEFQEVKGKNKKNKKSKMLKVDSRILGFNVTSAPDRINVGDRDYGDNS